MKKQIMKNKPRTCKIGEFTMITAENGDMSSLKRQVIKSKPRTCKIVESALFLPGHSYMLSVKRLKSWNKDVCLNKNPPTWSKYVSGIIFEVSKPTESVVVNDLHMGTSWCVEIVEA